MCAVAHGETAEGDRGQAVALQAERLTRSGKETRQQTSSELTRSERRAFDEQQMTND